MHFTQASILATFFLAPSALCAPRPSLCKGPGGNGLTNCLTPDAQKCVGAWDGNVEGAVQGIQQWGINANNVNAWDQGKFDRELIDRACAPSGIKSNYKSSTLILTATWDSSRSCTAGRVTAAIGAAAGKRRIDCSLEEHPEVDIKEIIDGVVEGTVEAGLEFGGGRGE